MRSRFLLWMKCMADAADYPRPRFQGSLEVMVEGKSNLGQETYQNYCCSLVVVEAEICLPRRKMDEDWEMVLRMVKLVMMCTKRMVQSIGLIFQCRVIRRRLLQSQE